MDLHSSFGREVRFIVIHPKYGRREVLAYCGLEAKLIAANEWNVSYAEIADSKVGVERAVLEEYKKKTLKCGSGL